MKKVKGWGPKPHMDTNNNLVIAEEKGVKEGGRERSGDERDQKATLLWAMSTCLNRQMM